MTFKFILPFATPSNNEVMRMHHRDRTKQHKAYAWEVAAALQMDAPFFEHCEITITRHASRFLDWDNMGGGLKFLFDAMVKNNLIKDDNPNCVKKLELKQKKVARKNQFTFIEIVGE